jgi:hypothetical protein
MASLLQRHLEHHSALYNRMCQALQQCSDPVQIYRLRPLAQTLHGVKARLLKARMAYGQVKVIESRVQSCDSRIRVLIAAGRRCIMFSLLNEVEVYKGVMRMYCVYSMNLLGQVDATLQKAALRLEQVLKP